MDQPNVPAPIAPKRNNLGWKIGCGCLVLIALFMVGCSLIVAKFAPVDTATPPAHRTSRHVHAQKHPGCSGAVYYEQAMAKANNASQYQAAYDASVAGLSRVDACNEDDQIQAKGYLLGGKAISEHHLSSGDSRTDINQAITLLAECQTQPALYGTRAGAACETEEETLISYKTQWEMDSQ